MQEESDIALLVTTTEQFHEEIENTLNVVECNCTRKYLSDGLISMIRYFDKMAMSDIGLTAVTKKRIDDVLDKIIPRQQLGNCICSDS